MNTETKQELKKEFREKFNYASFTWNGNNVTGVEFAKKERNRVEKFWLSKLDQAIKSKTDSLVEKVEEIEVSSVDDRLLGKTDEYLEGYNTSTERWRKIRDEIITLLKEDNTQ